MPQWVMALSQRSRLVKAEAEGKLELAHLEAVVHGNCGLLPIPAIITITFRAEIGQPDALLLQRFLAELEAARKQPFSPVGSGICQGVSERKIKLLGLVDSLGRLHRLHVLDWIDLMLWARLTGTTLEGAYLGKLFWPDEEINRRYRLVASTRPTACQLVSQSAIYALSRVGCGT